MSETSELRAQQLESLRGALAFRGFDPDTPVIEAGPTLAELADEVRRISILEVAPVAGIEWLKRTSLKLEVGREIQETLWRAYDRQIRDELDHGAYWGELYFMLTGEGPEPKPWDGEGMGASNVNIKVPPDVDDLEFNRRSVYIGAAFSLGLESGFAEIAFPKLMHLMKRADMELTRSFIPLLQQLGRDESRHLNIHRYAFHTLKDTQGPGGVELFKKMVNVGRRAFQVPEISEEGFRSYLRNEAPPALKGVLGGYYIRVE